MVTHKDIPVKVDDIKTAFDVRTSLNQDHVLSLAELIEAGVILPSIILTRKLEVVDGRHRLEAYKLLEIKTIPSIIKDFTTEEALVAALNANLGYGLPPSRKDIELTFQQLIEQGVSQTKLKTLFPLPPSIIRRYYNAAHGKLSERKRKRALEMISDGATLKEAAEVQKIPLEDLKKILSGKKRKTKAQDYKGAMETKHRSMSATLASSLKRVVEQWEDGDYTADQVREILQFAVSGAKRYLRTAEEWTLRFDNLVKKI